MARVDKVEMELVKLADGARLLRFNDLASGVSVERKLDASRPVREQKKQLGDVFKVAVARAHLAFS